MKNDPVIRDLFADAEEPPKPKRALNRCTNGCVYPSTKPLVIPDCINCGNPRLKR